MSIVATIGIIFACFLILILVLYAFVGVFSFPFYLFGLFFRIIYFPITLINTIFYPVGQLPYLVMYGFYGYVLFDLVLYVLKHFTSMKNHK